MLGVDSYALSLWGVDVDRGHGLGFVGVGFTYL